MREMESSLYWHVAEFFIRCTWAVETRRVRLTSGTKTYEIDTPQLVRRHDPRVDLDAVDAGVEWLSERMGPADLPLEVYRARG